MKWDKEGALGNLGIKKCEVCEEIKPVYVVVTLHGKKEMHFPCCSKECMEILSSLATEEKIKQKRR